MVAAEDDFNDCYSYERTYAELEGLREQMDEDEETLAKTMADYELLRIHSEAVAQARQVAGLAVSSHLPSAVLRFVLSTLSRPSAVRKSCLGAPDRAGSFKTDPRRRRARAAEQTQAA